MKRFLLFWTIIAMAFAAFAQERTNSNNANDLAQRETYVTTTEALNVGYTFMRTGGGTRSSNVRKQDLQLIYTGQAIDSVTQSATDCYYVFALQPKGFVIVAADERVEPILGYSYDNDFAVENMPDHVRGWLGNYEKQIEAVVKQDIAPEAETTTKWSRLKSGQSMSTRSGETVGPLLTTTWDQGQYYNAMCPEDANGPDGHVLTGCVATAMAQIINYWGDPVHGRGIHSYESNYGLLTVNYDSASYDYANMPNVLTAISTPQEVNAVATLMRDCGVAANMGYGPNESSSYDIDARAGLINFFRFSPNLSYAEKSYFSDAEWNALLQENIVANQPVMYSGHGTGGHSFVCDGYDTEGFYHFNFGWSGYADGWYLTTGVIPDGYDFSSSQTILVGIVPDSTGNVILGQMAGNSTFTVDKPLEFFHLLGHNKYHGTDYSNSFNSSKTIFVAADTTIPIVANLVYFEGDQSAYVYYGNGDDYHMIYENMSWFPTITSFNGSFTIDYWGRWHYAGFCLSISPQNACGSIPFFNVFTTVDSNQINLSWTDSNNEEWDIEYGFEGIVHGEGETMTVYSSNVNIDNLTPFTYYSVYVKPSCSNIWTGPFKVKTDLSYWQDYVNEEPEGIIYNDDGYALVSTPEQLSWLLRNNSNCEKILLTSDIDMSAHRWKPVGYPYIGREINGGGHAISNLLIRESKYSLLNYIGFFGEIYSNVWPFVIRDINFVNPNISAERSVTRCGVLAGEIRSLNYTHSIINCGVSGGSIDCVTFSAGGLLGAFEGNMINCYSNVSIKNSHFTPHTGGLVGDYYGGKMINCYTASEIVYTPFYCSKGQVVGAVVRGLIRNVYGKQSEYTLFPFVQFGELYDVASFGNDNQLNPGIVFDDSTYTDLCDVLNVCVKSFNDSTIRCWINDSISGYPIFGDHYHVTCNNASNIISKNVKHNGHYAIKLGWNDSLATSYSIKCVNISDSTDSIRLYYTDTIPYYIEGLNMGDKYDIYVRCNCDSFQSGWGEPVTIVFDKPYWTDVVTSQPDGYTVEADGHVTITSAEGLSWFASCVNGLNGNEVDRFRNKKVKLNADIDLGEYRWMPVGYSQSKFFNTDQSIEFQGEFNGNGHIISNLYVNEDVDDVGLFGRLFQAKVINITIKDSYFKGKIHVGGLCGIYANSDTWWDEFNYGKVSFDNCHVQNTTVYGTNRVGGLLGLYQPNIDNSIIRNCSSSGTVWGGSEFGGLIGFVAQLPNKIIENSYSVSEVKYNNETGQNFSGGLIGYLNNAELNNCYTGGVVDSTIFYSVVGVIDNSHINYLYGLLDTIHTSYSLYGICSVQNTTTFTELEGQEILQNPVTIGDTSYSDLLSALNAWVDAYDTAGVYRHWAVDSTGVNGGFPVFAAPQSYTLTLAIDITTPYGEVNGGGTYNEFETAIIHATAQEGYHFVQWSDGNTDNPRTIVLTKDSTLTAQFGINMYSVIGTTSTSVDYVFDFEDVSEDDKWTFLNDNFTNRWYINMLDDNRALYISNDYGTSNDYDEYEPSSVFAYTTLLLDSGQYNFSYDWRCNAESHYDYLRVALIPNSVTLDNTDNTWSAYTLPNDAISLDNEYQLAGQSTWANQSGTIEVNSADEYKMVFHWHNDGSVKNVPPAAVDNIHLYTDGVDYFAMGTVLGSDTVPYLDTVTLTAVPNPGYRFVQWDDENTDNPRVVVATNNKKFVAIFECLPVIVIDSIITCDSYSWKGVDYFESTVLFDTLTNATGCDSVVTLYLTINHATISDTMAVACDNYTWNGTTYAESGDYSQTFTNASGCDSIVTLHLTINYSNTGIDEQTACESFTWIDGVTYTESTDTPTYTLTNAAGCDSVVTLHLTVNYGTHNIETEVACDSYEWYGESYSTSGTYTYEYTNADGCPSVDTLYLTINNSTTGIDEQTACESFTWIDGVTYTESTNTPTFTLTNAAGCDSVVTLHLTVNYGTHNTETEVACDSYEWNGETYTTTAVYTYEYTNADGCPSVDTLYLTINYSTTGIDEQTACEAFTWIDGVTYTESTNTPTFTLTNAAGCDSIVTLILTINSTYHEYLHVSACEEYVWNGETYLVSGDYDQTFTAANGCDSVVTLHLTVNYGTHNAETEVACDSYEWNGETYTTTGVYTYEYTNADGCPSVDTLHLTINYSTTGIDEQTACDSFTWIDGVTYTESTNTPTFTLTNAAGCDSIVTLILTINSTYHEYLHVSACEEYVWNGETYLVSGDYDQTFTAANGCDSVVTLHLTVNYGTHNAETEVACDSYEWNGETYATSGTYTYEYTNADGCPSVDTLHLTINYSTSGIDEQTACESFTWIDGVTYTESTNTPTFTLTNAAGCDSVVTLHLIIYESTTSEFSIVTDDPCYTWNGIDYCESGDYTQTLQTVHGCDSVVTLHLTITVGIDGHETVDFKVFPNPTTGILNVQCTMNNVQLEGAEIQVVDMYGKLVDVVGANNYSPLRTIQIDLSRYAAGVYFLKAVADGETIAVRKVVKQ